MGNFISALKYSPTDRDNISASIEKNLPCFPAAEYFTRLATPLTTLLRWRETGWVGLGLGLGLGKRGALALIWVKSCRSRPHLGCAGLKARSAPAESQDF